MFKLKPYSTKFKQLFEKEKERILKSTNIKEIHHVGSTAVKKLGGKGVIDILIGIEDFKDVYPVINRLETLGYIARFIDTKKEWAFLSNKKVTELGDFHIHIIKKSGKDWEEWFLFRDYLRKHSNEAEKYSKLKETWVKKAKGKRKKYTELKNDYIKSIIEKAKKPFT